MTTLLTRPDKYIIDVDYILFFGQLLTKPSQQISEVEPGHLRSNLHFAQQLRCCSAILNFKPWFDHEKA